MVVRPFANVLTPDLSVQAEAKAQAAQEEKNKQTPLPKFAGGEYLMPVSF